MATTVGGVVPADTMQAMLNLAHNPGSNAQTLFNMAPPQPPFEPILPTAPNDWTLSLTFTGGGLSTPQAIAIDSSGDAWVANASNAITELSAATGAQLSGTAGFTSSVLDAPVSLAIDTTGAVWIANCGNPCSGSGNPSSVARLSADGQTFTDYSPAALNGSYAVALNGSNQPWIANALGGSLTELNADGSVAYATADAAALLYPVSVALAPDGTAWTVSPQSNGIVSFTAAGKLDPAHTYQGAGLNFPFALALDHAGRAWVANHGANSVSVFDATAQMPLTAYTGGGLAKPVSIALDGNGDVWVTNANDSLSEFANGGTAMSPAAGFSANLSYPNGVAVDGSGNVWVTSCGHYCEPSSANQGSVTVVVGAATPVVTPLAIGIAHNTLAELP
jgi:sugar lactone lactonase YvrE